MSSSTLEEQQSRQAILMDQIYGRQRHIYDFTRKYYLLGRDRLIENLRLRDGMSVLEIGCGTGRNLIRIGEKYPGAVCYGFDISEKMLEQAKGAIVRTGMKGHLHLARGDAEAFDAQPAFGKNGFDRVILSYTLSMIPDWEKAIENALRQVASGGELHITDFGQMSKWPSPMRRGMLAWLNAFHVTPRGDLLRVARRHAQTNAYSLQFEQMLGGYAWVLIIRRNQEISSFQ